MEQSQTTSQASGSATTAFMPGRRRFIPFALLIVLTAGALVTAVLSSSSPASASTAVRAALTSTMTATSVSFTFNEDVTGTQSAELSVSGSCATGPECHVTLSGAGEGSTLGTTQLVVTNGVAYVEPSGSLASDIPTPWISVPVNSSSAQGAGVPTGTDGLSSILDQLVNVGDTVTDNGEVTLNGATVHEYTVTASASVEQQQFSTLLNALPSSVTSSLGSVSLSGYGVDIYVDPDGNIGELALKASLSTAKNTETLSTTLTLSGYGDPVSVIAPPANEVTPLSSVIKSPFASL
jgi:hypothetical protein